MIRITSKQDGFRRCGAAHFVKPTDYDHDHFTDDQIAEMENEPMLLVELVDGQGGPNAAGAPQGHFFQGAGRTGAADGDPDDAASQADIIDVINALDAMDATLWTGNGAPKVPVISEILGEDITAAQRDEAWAQLKSNQ